MQILFPHSAHIHTHAHTHKPVAGYDVTGRLHVQPLSLDDAPTVQVP